jgi:hypothetical protein
MATAQQAESADKTAALGSFIGGGLQVASSMASFGALAVLV